MHWENWKGYLVIVLALALVCGFFVCLQRGYTQITHHIMTAYRAYPSFGATKQCPKCGNTTLVRIVHWNNAPHTITVVCGGCTARTYEQTLDAPKEEKHVTR
jgi:hypothetical protein